MGAVSYTHLDVYKRQAHSDRLPAHALQRAETELVADDKGDEAQCHLCDDAVALDLCKMCIRDSKHTFYVDNIFVYQPLPFVKSMY